MTEPLPLSLAAERPKKEELLAALRVEKALYAAMEAEARTPGLGRIGADIDAADAMRLSRARIMMLQRLYDGAAETDGR